MPIIADYTYYTGGGRTKLSPIEAPYKGRSEIDSDIEPYILDDQLLNSISAEKISTGVLSAVATLGSTSGGYVRLDGSKRAVIVNINGTDQIWLGYLAGKF